ncbi:tetratricopeptide repeat protein [Muriicola soli]|uniref:tetratricopeptide repeat protein n=1 Tax=Muriicola soli TaxID=2507538 RepID=UPI001FED0DE4|nr:tetratricopeptide repeat protein [Muriicola soli]
MRHKSFYYSAYIFIGFFFFAQMCLHAQDQNTSDSIKILLESNPTIDSLYLERLKIVAVEETDPVLAREFSERLITLAKQDSLTSLLIDGYLQKGNAEIRLGNLAAALKSYFEGIAYAVKIKDISTEGKLYTSIAGVYSEIGSEDNAMMYYNKAISILRQTTDSASLAGTLLNAGEEYFYSKKYDSALLYNQEAEQLFKDLKYTLGSAYTLGNTGMVYAAMGDNARAESAMNQAINVLIELEDYYPISVYLIYMADIYLEKNDINTAKSYVYRSLDLAQQYGLKDQISQANLKLAEIFDLQNDPRSAYNHYKEYVVYRDSVNNIAEVQKMADLRTDYEVSQKQIELDLADQRRINQRNISIATSAGLILIGLLAFGLYRRNQFVRKTKKIIEKEKERSDNLLLNICLKKRHWNSKNMER